MAYQHNGHGYQLPIMPAYGPQFPYLQPQGGMPQHQERTAMYANYQAGPVDAKAGMPIPKEFHHPQQPGQGMHPMQAKFQYGDPDIMNHPGFAAAAAAPPKFDANHQARQRFYEAMEDEQVMTPESEARLRAKLQNEEQSARKFQQKHPDLLPVDLQEGRGKIRTARSVYTIHKTLEPGQKLGGDPNRMSDGVYLVKHPNGEYRVAKFVKVDNQNRQERARAERNVLQALSGANSAFVNFCYEAYWPSGDEHCIMILQFCNGGTIEGWMRHKQKANELMAESFLWHTLHNLCSALSLCHYGIKDPLKKELQPKTWNAICHLDIKLPNVFVDTTRGRGLEDDEYPTIVLGDFGCAVTHQDIKTGRFCNTTQPFGTPDWYPPEGRPGWTGNRPGRYGKGTDIWQVGAVISCMARLIMLPDLAALNSGRPCGPAYSKDLNQIVAHMLDPDIDKRPTAVDVVEKMAQWGKMPEDLQAAVSKERAGL